MLCAFESSGRIRFVINDPVPPLYELEFVKMGYETVPIDALPSEEIDRLYVLNGVILQRPDLPVSMSRSSIRADGTRLATITGIPPATTVVIDGVDHVVEDGRLDLVSTVPADYALSIDRWPYLPWSTTIVVR